MEIDRYNRLNKYLKAKFGSRTLKICIDGGFTCPNRDGTCGTGGCIFCSEMGSGEHISKFNKCSFSSLDSNIDNICLQIKNQVNNYFNSYKADRAQKFIAYFQNYTNTYDKLPNLKAKYDSALINNKIVALAIATRPDCINDDICKLLSSYKERNLDVWVELGLQTSNDKTAKLINRGYESNTFAHAVNLLNKYNIDVVAHIIVGLPNESHEDIKNTVSFLNSTNIQGLKIHSCYVCKNTVLEKMMNNGLYEPISLEYYIENVSYILTHISPNIIILKLSGDADKELLVAPSWNAHKKWIINGIDKYLREHNLYQGMYYKK